MEIFSTWQYALFCANIHHFNNQVTRKGLEKLYIKWIKHHERKTVITNSSWKLPTIMKLISSKPSIICLYHLGYHAQIPFVLADNNIKFDILMDRSVYEKQKDQFFLLQEKFNKQGNAYNILFSDDVRVLLKARKSISEGRSILIFADGNSGASVEVPNRVKVSFFNSEIAVRKGIGLLSFLLKTPIVPLTQRKTSLGFSLVAGGVIYPTALHNREDYIHYALQRLYDFLENQIRDKLYLWEGWIYLHEMNCFDMDFTVCSNYDSERSEFLIPLQLKGKWGYFDCKSYRFILNSS
jgi:lauroyl/myristoyl acyltransferase